MEELRIVSPRECEEFSPAILYRATGCLPEGGSRAMLRGTITWAGRSSVHFDALFAGLHDVAAGRGARSQSAFVRASGSGRFAGICRSRRESRLWLQR